MNSIFSKLETIRYYRPSPTPPSYQVNPILSISSTNPRHSLDNTRKNIVFVEGTSKEPPINLQVNDLSPKASYKQAPNHNHTDSMFLYSPFASYVCSSQTFLISTIQLFFLSFSPLPSVNTAFIFFILL